MISSGKVPLKSNENTEVKWKTIAIFFFIAFVLPIIALLIQL
jgi:hypothetical protein